MAGGLRCACVCQGTSGSVWFSRLGVLPPVPAQHDKSAQEGSERCSMSPQKDSMAAHTAHRHSFHGLYGTLIRLPNATPRCTAHKGRLLGLGLAASSSADVRASSCFWASSCLTSCIRSICRPAPNGLVPEQLRRMRIGPAWPMFGAVCCMCLPALGGSTSGARSRPSCH